ncbi:MAG TPA: hypothetical protein DCS85_00450, partial [Verrucomicrobiales bacterium]|nr:hypothetical protein [Verrucomicrobiales bacterium]
MAGLAAVLMGLLATQARSESRDHEQDLQFFERRIRPALVTHCYECHSASSKKVGGKLYLDHAGGLLRGGESGSAIVPGRPGESLLIRAIRKENDDLVMPPDDKPSLPEAVVNDLVEWVRRGAPDPRASPGEKSPRDAQPNGAALWSFQPVDKPAPPRTRDQDWPRDDIDRFLLAQLESREFRPADDAPPGTLIRRLYFDLVGLAPTYDEVGAFLNACQQNRQSAVEALVDRLLASPHFGERWGRHWL